MKRFFNKRKKKILALVSGRLCQMCGEPLGTIFHADHIQPFSKGGRTILQNGQALCPTCNLKKGSGYAGH